MKKLISVLLALAMLLSLAACTASPAPKGDDAAEDQQTAQAESPAVSPYPVTFTDQAGRQVSLSEAPQRIVSGYYIATSSLIALGLREKIVGLEAKAEKRAIYRLSAPELIELPNVGTAKEFDLEGCIALQPDLVILPLRLKSAAESLEQLGIPVMLVNPESQELLLEMIDLMALSTGTAERADALHTFISQQETRLSRISGNAPSVYLAGNSSLLSTAGSNMYQSDMITLAGGENAAAELTDTNWADISYEQLLAWDPAYIVLASDASYSVEDVLSDPNLSQIHAVQEGNVIHLPSSVESWDSPIPGSILGSVWLAAVLHPDEVPSEEVNGIITAFYEQFYGFTYTAE